ncbi:MAG: hypothetical protein HYV33_02055 [Candidatus Kerfeldbacteria bacterium]|nr:hypothetical protein [Candidatus Kerfeldbacteria bacterium]
MLVEILHQYNHGRITLEQYINVLEHLSHEPGSFARVTVQQNQVWQTALQQLQLSPQADAATIQAVIQQRRQLLATLLEQRFPTVYQATAASWQHSMQTVMATLPNAVQRGEFIKLSVAKSFLLHYPPAGVLQQLGYTTITDCLKKHPILEVLAALRFTETDQWMKKFLSQYHQLSPDDFEERPVQILVLPANQWGTAAVNFAKKKKHFFSHLKEYGIVFAFPTVDQVTNQNDLPVFFAMVLHYIFEVNFYTRWVQQHRTTKNFGRLYARILKGDGDICILSQYCLPIIQQYHLKRPQPHPCAFAPHVMPEALHWRKATSALLALLKTQPNYAMVDFWTNCYTAASLINHQLVSLNFADAILSNSTVVTYHVIEDLWNSVLAGYIGDQAVEQNIIEHLAQRYINLEHLFTPIQPYAKSPANGIYHAANSY